VVLALEIRGLRALVPTWAARHAEHADDELGWVVKGALLPLLDGVHRLEGEVLAVQGPRVIAWWPETGGGEPASSGTDVLHRAAWAGARFCERFSAHLPAAHHPVRLRLTAAVARGDVWGGVAAQTLWIGGPGPARATGLLDAHDLEGLVISQLDAQALPAETETLPLPDGAARVQALPPLEATPDFSHPTSAPQLPDLVSPLVRGVLSRAADPERLVQGTVLALSAPVASRAEGEALLTDILIAARVCHGLAHVPQLASDKLTLRLRFGLGPDARRHAVDDALGLCLALRSRFPHLSAGVATGPLFVAPLHAEARDALVATGPTVVRAVALSHSAGARMDQATHLEAGPHVLRTATEGAAPDTPWTLRGLADADPLEASVPLELFGRGEEVGRLQRGMAALAHGGSAVILFEGVAGIGKSALVDAVPGLAAAAGLTSWHTGARAEGREEAWHAWHGLVEPLLGLPLDAAADARRAALDALLADQPELHADAPLLAPLLVLDLPDTERTARISGGGRARRTEELLVALVQARVAQGPLVIVAEDAHWFDPESWSLTLALSQHVHPLLLVLTTRPLPEPPPPAARRLLDTLQCTRWPLTALPLAGTEAVLRGVLGVDILPRPLVRWVHERGDGNPLATQELGLAMRESGRLIVVGRRLQDPPSTTDLDNLPLPDRLEEVIQARIQRLAPSQQALIGAASIVGPVVGLNVLRDVHPVEGEHGSFDADLEALEGAELAHAAGQGDERVLAFKHQLTLEAAYAQMPASERRNAHESLARYIESRHATHLAPHLGTLAHHWEQAGDLPKALDYLEEAGDQAVRLGAWAEAVHHLKHALSLHRSARDGARVPRHRQARWLRLLAEAQVGLGQMHGAHQHAEQALGLLDLPTPRGTWGQVLVLSWELVRHAILVATWGLWHARNPDRRARLTEGALAAEKLSRAQYFELDLLGFVTSCVRSVNLGARAGRDAPVSRSYAMLSLLVGLRLALPAHLYIRRADRIAASRGDPREIAFNNQIRSLHHMGHGRWTVALEHASLALAGHREVADTDGVEIGHTMLAMVAFFQGDHLASHEHFSDLVDAARQSGNRQHEAWGIYSLARIEAMRGVLDEPVERIHSALDLLEDIEDQASRAICWGSLALVHVRRGEWQRARDCADRAGALCWGSWPTTLAIIDALWQMVEAHQALWERAVRRGTPDADSLAEASDKGIKALRRFALLYPLGRPYLAVAKARAALITGQARPVLLQRTVELCGRAGAGYCEAVALGLRTRLEPEVQAAARARFEALGCTWHLARLDESAPG